jgi:DNA-binding transcriptional LysR family regulator
MTNIPTELLRTLVAVVDLRSFTKAAQSLGVTQPAVSAQIKRLQGLLGTDLLDKSAPGVSLTSAGELVVNYARRLLTINDQILDLSGPRPSARALRIGAAGDSSAADIALAAARFHERNPESRFYVQNTSMDALQRELREGLLDIAVWVSGTGPSMEARHCWTEELVWMRAAAMPYEPARPVPLVSYGEDCPFTRCAIAALNAAGRESEIVLMGSSIAAIGAAVAAGLGVTVLPAGRTAIPGVSIWENAPLPKLPEVFCGVSVRPGCESERRDNLADALAHGLRMRSVATNGSGNRLTLEETMSA